MLRSTIRIATMALPFPLGLDDACTQPRSRRRSFGQYPPPNWPVRSELTLCVTLDPRVRMRHVSRENVVASLMHASGRSGVESDPHPYEQWRRWDAEVPAG